MREKSSEEKIEEQLLHHRVKKVYKILLILLLIAAGVFAVWYQLENQVYTRYEQSSRMERVGSEQSKYLDYNGALICYSMDGIMAYDTNGNQLWNQTYQMQNACVDVAGDYVAVADYQGNRIFLLNKQGLVTTIDTNIPVLFVKASAGGVVMAALQDEDTVFLRMYKSDGSLVTNYRTTMRGFGYPMTYAISPDNIKVGISYMRAISGKVSTAVAFYNFGGVGQNETDNLVSSYECEDETVPYIAYLNDTDAVAVGSKKVRIFSGKQTPKLEKEYELDREINAVFSGGEHFALVTDSDDERYDIHVYDKGGNEKVVWPCDFEYTDISLLSDRMLIYNQTRLVVVSYNNVVKFDGQLSGSILHVIPTDRYAGFFVVYEDKSERIRLR
ncbi:MAG: hypothetical protein IK078_08165 [Lachnospiraceae bacterium]|nr:hypothetical protein [Lachnospiraceae bacterium]